MGVKFNPQMLRNTESSGSIARNVAAQAPLFAFKSESCGNVARSSESAGSIASSSSSSINYCA